MQFSSGSVPNWPDSFGDVTAEYAAAHQQVGLVGAADSLLWVSGPDAVSFLHGIISQDVINMVPGQTARSFLLSPRGMVEDLFWVLRGPERVGIITSLSQVGSTLSCLNRWKIRVKVDMEPDPRPVFQLWGPAPMPDGLLDVQQGWIERNGVLAAALPTAPFRRRILVLSSAEGLKQSSLVQVGKLVHGVLRVEAGEPLMGVDLDEKTIPQETGLVDQAISFTKGCFLGQELVARLDSRGGRVNRRLRAVRMLDTVIPPVGAQVEHQGRTAGRLTTVGESFSVRAPVGMGMLHREAEPGAEVRVAWTGGGVRGVVEEIPIGGIGAG